MNTDFKVVVVGGGIVGCSVLYHLARFGWTDCLLIEKRELTSGSTWHAAGNTTFFGHYPAITQLFVNSIRTYQAASAESGQDISFHDAGSLRLASTPRELAFYENLRPLYQDLGVEYDVIGTEQIAKIHPLLNIEGLLGAAHTPTDGHVDPTGATMALARAAKIRGATIKTQTPCESFEPHGKGWRIETKDGPITADHVVLATSFWSREMAEPLGLNLPVYALQHHEIITEDIPALAALSFEVPTVRDPRAPSNTRQERNGFLCGIYETQPEFWATDGIPPNFAEELLPPNIDRLESHLLRVMDAIPAFGEAGIKAVNNGPISYAPDGLPLLGPVETHPGLWLATAFNIGIGTGGGSAGFLADWIVNGQPSVDLSVVYPSRFPNDLTKENALAAISATYGAGYSLPKSL